MRIPMQEPADEPPTHRVAVPHARSAGPGCVLPVAGDRRACAQPHRLRSLRAGKYPQPALCGVAELLGAIAASAVLVGARAHGVFRGGRCAVVDGYVTRRCAAVELTAGTLQTIL